MSFADHDAYVSAVQTSVRFIQDKFGDLPEIGIVLGTGLGSLADLIEIRESISYPEIPNFPVPTVESHEGRLIVGKLGGKDVVALQGRFHLYEGYSPRQATLPIRALALAGVKTLILSGASGGMNQHLRRSDLVLITDHINFMGRNPLEGPNHNGWGPRFPDMSSPYDVHLQDITRKKAVQLGIPLKEGVYVAVVGPNLETRAEYRMLLTLGADIVGMSTVPEVLVARHMGLRVLAVSVVTDECHPDTLAPVSIEEVLEAAAIAEPELGRLIESLISDL